jgi:hypothetical protein
LDDAGSAAVTICDDCSRASRCGGGCSALVSGGSAVDSRTGGANASLCYIRGGSGVQVGHLCKTHLKKHIVVLAKYNASRSKMHLKKTY